MTEDRWNVCPFCESDRFILTQTLPLRVKENGETYIDNDPELEAFHGSLICADCRHGIGVYFNISVDVQITLAKSV